MSEKKLNEIIYYSDYFYRKDFKSDIVNTYKKHIKHYAKNVSVNFAKLMLKDIIKEYFKKEEKISIDYRVISCRLFLDECFKAIMEVEKCKI